MSAQQEVHVFYRPAVELTAGELSAHRQAVTTREQSLPNRAGKHYRRIRAHYYRGLGRSMARTATQRVVGAPASLGRKSSSPMNVVIHTIAQPEPDLDHLLLAALATLDHPQNG